MVDISNKCEGDESRGFMQKARDIANSFYGQALIGAMTALAAASLYCAKPAYAQKAEAAEASVEQTVPFPEVEKLHDLGYKNQMIDLLGNFPGDDTYIHRFESKDGNIMTVVFRLPNGKPYGFSELNKDTKEEKVYWRPFGNQKNFIQGTRTPPYISLETYGYLGMDKVSQK